MEKVKNLKLGVLAYVLTAVLFFGAGYMSGNYGNEVRYEDTAETASANAENAEEIIYRVKIQNDKLCIYEITSEGINTEAECDISESVYPKDDITELKAGIDFRNKNDAQAMFENFSS